MRTSSDIAPSAPSESSESSAFADHRASLRRLPVDGGHLAYLDAGPRDGRPVLLLHGIPTSSWLYRTIAPRLAADGLRAVAPDLLGFGASAKPRGRAVYSARRQADRLVALLDHLALPTTTLVVHDAGGPWGFEIADRHPDRVAGLVVLNTTGYADAFTPPRDVRMLGGSLGPAMLAMMRSPLGRPVIHRMLARLSHTGKALDPSATEPHWQALREGGTAALRAFAQDLDGFTGEFQRYAAALRRLEVPAALIWGSSDPVLRPERLVPRFTEDLGLSSDDVHVLDGAGHFLQEDRPGDIADVIIGFARRLRESSPSRSA